MGSTHHDPIDHFRTTGRHAGEFFIDLYCWPGLISIVLGAFSLVGCVAAAAYNHHEWILTAAVVGALAIAGGIAWLVLEHHRVLQIERRWLDQHAAKPIVSPFALPPQTLGDETTAQQWDRRLPQHNRIDWA